MKDDEYIYDLCDEVLHRRSLRRHQFHFLRNDDGRKRPVGAFYSGMRLAVEYSEDGGAQRPAFLERLRKDAVAEETATTGETLRSTLARFGVRLLELGSGDFTTGSNGRLARDRERDLQALQARIAKTMRTPLRPLRPRAIKAGA